MEFLKESFKMNEKFAKDVSIKLGDDGTNDKIFIKNNINGLNDSTPKKDNKDSFEKL